MLSSTTRRLQKMLHVCDDFANEYSVKLNARKQSVCVFLESFNAEIYLYSSLGKSCPEAIMSSTWEKIFVMKPKWLIWCSSDTGLFYGFVNTLGAKFKCVLGDINLATKLFMSYCCSVYVCQLWDLSSTWFDAICVALNKAVHCIFQLPYNTYRFLLPYVVDGIPIRDQLLKCCV